MSAFNKLMEEFSAATGVDTVVDGERSCTLEADGMLVTLQCLEDADEVVLFAPAWQPEAEGALPSSATMRAALELGYDGKETGGAHIGLSRIPSCSPYTCRWRIWTAKSRGCA